MPTASSEQLTSKIIEFARQQGSCLFAGAGVAKRAGLPSWDEYLEHLSSIAGRYDKDLEALMRKRLRARLYLETAELYKTAVEIPEGIKYAELSSPFTSACGYTPEHLHALMALPFSAVVTTNYDRSLLDAYYSLFSKQKESGLNLKAPKYVELGDLSMRQAIFWADFYIARIHGRVEIPETMVLDRNDYHRTDVDPYYQDFLLNILKNYRCLFIGYSFLDPAINRVLELMRKTLPHPYVKLHVALLPNDGDTRLHHELAKYNIEIIEYDSSDNHESLWGAIKSAQREIRTLSRIPPNKLEPVAGLTRFVASCYSRLKMGNKTEPLRDIVIEGIIAQSIIDSGPQGTSENALIQSVKKYISLSDYQMKELVRRAIGGLLTKGLCTKQEEVFKCQQTGQDVFDTTLGTLVNSIINKLKVREGVEVDQDLRASIEEIVNRLLLTRGWDMGAHFAGGNPSSTFEAWPQIQNAIENLTRSISPSRSKALANAIFDLFRHPEDREAELLADVGRVAFAVEIILNNARASLQLFVVPEIIYLDSNVLMPAIVDGHPYSPVYADAITRMAHAAKAVGTGIQILTSKDFLNEVIHHRNLAIQEVQEQGLEDIERLKNRILIYGAENTNVYIGSYGSFVGRKKQELSFRDFLERVAPYDSEKGLEEFLDSRGIGAIRLSFTTAEEANLYKKLNEALHEAYEELGELPPYYFKKPALLIDHEAAQLTRLILDMKAGLKPLFVTADKRLMGLCRGETLEPCANAIISHLGFVQLVDLALGLDTDKRSLARLCWSVELTDEETVIRNYLIDLALQHYDEAKAMAMWEVVDRISEEATRAAKSEGITLFPSKEENKARTADFLDRFEQDFFKNMAEVIKRKEEKGQLK